MKIECWTAVRGESGRDFAQISPKLAVVRSQPKRGRGPERAAG